MKKIVKHVRSSTHVQFWIFGITSLLATLAVVGVSATSAKNSSSQGERPVVPQQKSEPTEFEDDEEFLPIRVMAEALPRPVGFRRFDNPAPVPKSLLPSVNAQINDDNGTVNCSGFTQAETSVVSFGSTIVVGFNDGGEFQGGTTNHFTGWSRSTDGGVTWTDGGTLPDSPGGSSVDPVLALDTNSGRIYFATLGFSVSTIQVFRSTDNGATWMAPVDGTPGGGPVDKPWITVDNFPGSGNGNVYLVGRHLATGKGIIPCYRSTDGGDTFGPTGGTLVVQHGLGAFVTVSPDHSVNVYWNNRNRIEVSKSTDQGLTFGSPVTVVHFARPGGTFGDLGLTGVRNGTTTPAPFRTFRYPHVAVNPVSGNIYCAYNDLGTAAKDKADIFFVQSTDGGATWSSPMKVNDDITTTDQWSPNVVVSPAGDQLGIFYYSRQDDPLNNNLFKYYGRIGSISGATVTFGTSVAVSDTQSFPEFGRDNLIDPEFVGDYDQAYARPGFFDVVWSDNRNDLTGCAPNKDPDVFYQSIALGSPTPTPTP